MASRPGLIRRFFGFIWRLIGFFRTLVLNLLFLAIVAALVAAWFHEGRPRLEPDTTLVLDLAGPIVEQHTGAPARLTMLQALAERERETQLRDVLSALDAAATDPKIGRVLLLLDDMQGAGLATLREIAAAIGRVRAAGKEVIAWGSGLDQRRYYLAAHADQVLLHPFGRVLLQGLGGYRNYYRDALESIGVTVNVFKVGRYKSAVEPFSQNEPSEEAQRDEAALLGDLWSQYQSAVESARKLPAGSIGRLIDELPQRFAAAGGDAAKLALAEKLVDGLKTRDELRAMMIEKGVADPENKSFRQIGLARYLATLPEKDGDAVGVVVASGEMLDGDQPQGLVGGRSTAELIRRAREDDSVKAVVLRVRSPGGSVFAAEQIRHELEITRRAGKPVLVSFGDVAASGGYWVSMSADEVIADPGTVTGSIGVFALLPSADRAWEKLSLHTHGTTTTWLAGAFDPRRPLDPRAGPGVDRAAGTGAQADRPPRYLPRSAAGGGEARRPRRGFPRRLHRARAARHRPPARHAVRRGVAAVAAAARPAAARRRRRLRRAAVDRVGLALASQRRAQPAGGPVALPVLGRRPARNGLTAPRA